MIYIQGVRKITPCIIVLLQVNNSYLHHSLPEVLDFNPVTIAAELFGQDVGHLKLLLDCCATANFIQDFELKKKNHNINHIYK